MISDNDLYSLAIFLGSLAMLLIVIYHFLEINAKPDEGENFSKGDIKALSSSSSLEDEKKGGRQAIPAGRGNKGVLAKQ